MLPELFPQVRLQSIQQRINDGERGIGDQCSGKLHPAQGARRKLRTPHRPVVPEIEKLHEERDLPEALLPRDTPQRGEELKMLVDRDIRRRSRGAEREADAIAARPGAEVLVGLKEEVTPESFRAAIADGTAERCLHRIPVAAGDTKVVERGRADGLYVTTAGVGVLEHEVVLGPERVLPGDRVLLSCAPSLDTVGFFTRNVADLETIWSALRGTQAADPELMLRTPPRIAAVEDEMQNAFEATLARLRQAGFRIEPLELPVEWQAMVDAVRDIQAYEGARVLKSWWDLHGPRLGMKLADLIRYGLSIPESRYEACIELLEKAAAGLEGAGFIATPAAPGPAPRGLSSTGAPTLNSPWTGTGRPAISIPMPAPGLPLGLQIAGERGQDAALIALARRAESALC